MVCDFANRGPKWAGGKVTFYTAALCATLVYRNLGVRVVADSLPVYEGPAYLVAVANGQFFGGGMHIAPEANVSDGLLDVIILGDYSRLGAVGLSRAIYAGTHVDHRKTVTARARVVEVLELQPNGGRRRSVLETDGEVPPLQLPLRLEVFAGAVSMCI
jgi:diacylglycerol kinase family enzyme